jgi:alkylation response protein AidB-like acyl-CoA dehydrogenase
MKPSPLTTTAPELATWLDANAEAIDTTQDLAREILPRLGGADLFRIGVPAHEGGLDGTTVDAIEAVASVAGHSLTAAFVFWGQRTFIDICCRVRTKQSVRAGCPRCYAVNWPAQRAFRTR